MTDKTTSAIDPAAIAAKLTAAQRRDLLASGEQWWSADRRTANGMVAKGLVEPHFGCCGNFTPLGLAVRASLENGQ